MKVGEYIRTKDGEIFKLNNIIYQDDNYIQYQLGGRLEDKDFLKSSSNIIDLIEVGDYVNGHYVFDKINGAIYIEDYTNKMAHIPYTKDNVESVLTKEQFERIEYKI